MAYLTAAATRIGRGGAWLTRSIDGAWLATAVAFTALFLVDRGQAMSSAGFVLDTFIDILPFLAFAVAAAAYAKASGSDALIARAFHGNPARMVLFAALIGALSPFCSCGVIPLVAALLAMGVPLAAVMAFWLASPVMDPSMFLLTAATLGTPFAVAKTAAAIGLGLLGGYGVMAGQRLGLFGDPLREGVSTGSCGTASATAGGPVHWAVWAAPERCVTFGREAVASLAFLAKWLVLAFLLESVMLAYVPADLIAAAVGGDGVVPVITAALVGVPAYFNGYAALPLVGGLIEQGMAPGAGMAFLVAGGVSCIPAAIAVFALVRAPVFAAYLAFALLGSIIAGLAYGLG